MLTAIRNSDQEKVIGDFIRKDNNARYFCEYCKKPVIHHKSEARIRIGHFKHKAEVASCPSEGETILHLRIKLEIYRYLTATWKHSLKVIELEKWICDNMLRPDIYLETVRRTRIAIEVQASALTVEEISRRTALYARSKIYVIWVVPFEYDRFFEEIHNYGYTVEEKYYIQDSRQVFREKVRLKEYELFLYWSSFKKLVLWDVEQKFSKEFIVAQLDEAYFRPFSMMIEGTPSRFSTQRSKMMKSVIGVKYDVAFNQFVRRRIKPFTSAMITYEIPERYIMVYNGKI